MRALTFDPEHTIATRNRLNKFLGFISMGVSNRSAKVIHKLYLVLVSSYLDHAFMLRRLYGKNDLNSLEAVSRRKSKMTQRLRSLLCKETKNNLQS